MGVPKIGKWQNGFALVSRAVIAPHYDEFPEAFSSLMFGGRPAGTCLIGVDGGTALVGMDGNWQVMGSRHVTVKRDGTTRRFSHGQEVKF